MFVLLAALLTVPWSFWVIGSAYDRALREKTESLAARVRIQVSNSGWWYSTPDQVLEPLRTELFGDDAVQAVAFLDFRRNGVAAVRKSAQTPLPRSPQEVKSLLDADPSSYRVFYTWVEQGKPRGMIYMDFSRRGLWNHFWDSYWGLLKTVSIFTAVGIVLISTVAIAAYQFWTRAGKQRRRAELEQQGMLAERGLAAAVLAHEIRNPLAALRFQLHSLRRNCGDPQRVSATADTIDAELLRVQQLLQNYLAHERAQSLSVEAVDLQGAAQSLRALMAEMLRESGTRLEISSPPAPVLVACDPHALRQVLINLVLNAQQAMGRGGLITVAIGRQDEFGTISVADTGPGIPEEMRDRLFKPFATSKKDGSGIGLALVKRFVDNFGGSVQVESAPGQGAKFTLRLPLHGQAPSEASGAESIAGSVRPGAIT